VRDNLLTAARDVGAGEALRRLGSSRDLAQQYLAAEFGDGPRHSWVAAALFCGGFPLLLNFVLSEATLGYQAISAASPHATGTFTWSGISYLQHAVVYTFSNGHGSFTGGDWHFLFSRSRRTRPPPVRYWEFGPDSHRRIASFITP